jgi:DNA-binding response OmpR family regulator
MSLGREKSFIGIGQISDRTKNITACVRYCRNQNNAALLVNGVNNYIVKPFDKDTLVSKVQATLDG